MAVMVDMQRNLKDLFAKGHFVFLKLPLLLILLMTGFILDFLISLPFSVLCALDNWSRKKRRNP